MANKPTHGMRGLMAGPPAAKSGHMPLRHPSGGNRIAASSPTARNGKHTGTLKAGDTRRRSGAEGNSKGTVSTGKKGASVASHAATAGRGAAGAMHSNRLSESPTHDWFEKLGA